MNRALAEDIITAPLSAAEINSVYLFAINACSPPPIRRNDSKIKCVKWQKKRDEGKKHQPVEIDRRARFYLTPSRRCRIVTSLLMENDAMSGYTSSPRQLYLDERAILLTFGGQYASGDRTEWKFVESSMFSAVIVLGNDFRLDRKPSRSRLSSSVTLGHACTMPWSLSPLTTPPFSFCFVVVFFCPKTNFSRLQDVISPPPR